MHVNFFVDCFKRFMNKEGNFEVSLCYDTKGLMSLYEASYVDMGEEILCKAREFSTKHLKASERYPENIDAEEKIIKRSLSNPIYKSLPRFEARHFIGGYKGNIGASKVLKDLAIMDFNTVQSLHKSELSKVVR
ncbi:Santalene synthase [Apostasia shenzhenica]|uniref:Santalene synthase n=1 Tax=Apostasia shenzhenica TaxID=1088818 RepID=A0A2H9ZZW7_9ASPA|nr:Santalene synthase [Apostasia shenzhenica]